MRPTRTLALPPRTRATPTGDAPRRRLGPSAQFGLVGTVALALVATATLATAMPAGAKSHSNARAPKPLGTTFSFPDASNTFVEVTLLRVVTKAPAKTHYVGLHGKGPVIGLEFSMKNISAQPASLALFSSVLYYSSGVVALTTSLGPTKLGSSLNVSTPLAAGSHRQGWMTVQGSRKKLEKIQSTLNGTNTGSWAP
jgi:hypothetical protein